VAHVQQPAALAAGRQAQALRVCAPQQQQWLLRRAAATAATEPAAGATAGRAVELARLPHA
jgi:hypothetical protein